MVRWSRVGWGVLLSVGTLAIFGVPSLKNKEPTPVAPVAVVAEPPKPPPEPPLLVRLSREHTLAGAIKLARPTFRDVNQGEDSGARDFTAWAIPYMTWSDLQRVESTQYGQVQKDPEGERGYRLCGSGTIVEISLDRSLGKPFASGLLMTDGGDVISFSVVGYNDGLIAKSWARLCGIVIGTYRYRSNSGTTIHAVDIVGMFDVPQNKTKPKTAR